MNATTAAPAAGILSPELEQEREQIIAMLTKAYWMELETVVNYLACSINPDGVRAQEVIRSLAEDVQEELGHARQFGERIKELYGVVPGSADFEATQDFLQPPEDQRDIIAVIRGVIEAETGAIEHYSAVVAATDELDPVTNDMVIDILHDEQRHRRLFEGFLREYPAEGA
jgi:bacterioferritin